MKRLLEMVSSISPFQVNEQSVVVSAPQVIEKGGNTLVNIDGRLDNGKYGNFPFRYNRFDLSSLSQRVISLGNATQVVDLLDQLNLTPIFTYKLGYGGGAIPRQAKLLAADIVNEPIALSTGATLEYGLRASPGSYLYQGTLKLLLRA